jgi:hypothetical protein
MIIMTAIKIGGRSTREGVSELATSIENHQITLLQYHGQKLA